jgi:hypothetical protein
LTVGGYDSFTALIRGRQTHDDLRKDARGVLFSSREEIFGQTLKCLTPRSARCALILGRREYVVVSLDGSTVESDGAVFFEFSMKYV